MSKTAFLVLIGVLAVVYLVAVGYGVAGREEGGSSSIGERSAWSAPLDWRGPPADGGS